MRNPSTEELLTALARIRALPRCACWPDDLYQVLADPQRGRLLRMEAARVQRQPVQRTRQVQRPRLVRRSPGAGRAPATLPLFDRKRAAGGDRDDD